MYMQLNHHALGIKIYSPNKISIDNISSLYEISETNSPTETKSTKLVYYVQICAQKPKASTRDKRTATTLSSQTCPSKVPEGFKASMCPPSVHSLGPLSHLTCENLNFPSPIQP